MKKAIKIDVENQSIYAVELSDDYKDIYTKIGNGCTTFAVPITFENQDSIFCDDEVLLRPDDIKGGFILKGWNYPIIGNAIILGCDEEGESIDAKTSMVDLPLIQFLTEQEAKDYGKKALSTPTMIFVS
jgi:hypothetical protein